jgi:hypothetical protein
MNCEGTGYYKHNKRIIDLDVSHITNIQDKKQ